MNFNKLPGFSSSYALSSLKNSGCKYMVRMTKFNELLILLLKENILPLWVATIHPLSQGLFRLHNKMKNPKTIHLDIYINSSIFRSSEYFLQNSLMCLNTWTELRACSLYEECKKMTTYLIRTFWKHFTFFVDKVSFGNVSIVSTEHSGKTVSIQSSI